MRRFRVTPITRGTSRVAVHRFTTQRWFESSGTDSKTSRSAMVTSPMAPSLGVEETTSGADGLHAERDSLDRLQTMVLGLHDDRTPDAGRAACRTRRGASGVRGRACADSGHPRRHRARGTMARSSRRSVGRERAHASPASRLDDDRGQREPALPPARWRLDGLRELSRGQGNTRRWNRCDACRERAVRSPERDVVQQRGGWHLRSREAVATRTPSPTPNDAGVADPRPTQAGSAHLAILHPASEAARSTAASSKWSEW